MFTCVMFLFQGNRENAPSPPPNRRNFDRGNLFGRMFVSKEIFRDRSVWKYKIIAKKYDFYDFRAETARLLAKLPPPAREIEFTAVKSGPY